MILPKLKVRVYVSFFCFAILFTFYQLLTMILEKRNNNFTIKESTAPTDMVFELKGKNPKITYERNGYQSVEYTHRTEKQIKKQSKDINSQPLKQIQNHLKQKIFQAENRIKNVVINWKALKSKKVNEDKTKPYLKFPLDVDMLKLLNNIESGEEQHHLKINMHNFTFLQNPSKKCVALSSNNTGDKLSTVLILVKSQPNNFHLRMWMRTVTQHKGRVRLLFLIGNSKLFNVALKREGTMYDDIIQMDYDDSYRNLTYKTMTAYEWASSFCPEAQYVLFQDDDFYINIDVLMDFLQKQLEPESVFVGHLIQEGKVIYRNPNHKWYLSKSDYPFDVLPPYFPGGAYVVSMYLTKILAVVFPYVKWIPIDDVYIGIVAAKLNIHLTDSKRFRFDKCVPSDKVIACKMFSNVKETLDTWKQSVEHQFLQEPTVTAVL